MSKALYRSLVITIIIVLSLTVGFVFRSIQNKAELKEYPREYSLYVDKYSREYGVPEYYIYGLIKYKSSFVSNHIGKNGEIGLMGVGDTEFDTVSRIMRDSSPKDALYGPETNIKYGTFMMSYIFTSFDSWGAVMLSEVMSFESVEELYESPDALDGDGKLKDRSVFENSDEFGELKSICEKYKKLYYAD